jgi:GATA-binding protein, other eukaryote
MTYSRSVSDSTMVGSATTANGSHDDVAWNGSSERAAHNNNNGDENHDARQITDSPPSSNGASLAHNNGSPPVCQNCGTSTTPLWRRNELGATLCNACGLFLKLHGRARPLNLKTDTIKSRNRVKSVTQPKKKVQHLSDMTKFRWYLTDRTTKGTVLPPDPD